jgi:hypothetical protein
VSALSGWECKIKFPVKQLTKERIIDSDGKDATGDGVKTTFYTRSFPVVDANGTITDDETLVTVYVDDVAQQSTAFTLTGAEGKIVFAAAPANNTVIKMTYKYAKTVGYGQSAAISHAANIKPIREIGSRLPVELKEGNAEISITIKRCWLDRDFLGKGWHPEEQPEFDVDVCPNGIGSGKPYIRVTGKMSEWSMDVSQDAIIMESVAFAGRVIDVGTQA